MAGELERRPMGDLVSAKDGGDGGHLPVGNVVKKAVELAAIPAFAMLVGAMQPFLSSKQPGRRVTFALQRFAGGLILSAVAGELYPPLTEAKGSVWELTCVLIGFTAGVAVMFLLKEYLEEDGEGEKGEKVDIQSGDDEEEVQIVEENFCFDNDGCVAIREADGVLPAGRVLRSPFHLSVRRPDSIMSENNEQLIVREIESWATEDIQDRTKNRIDGLKGRTKDAVESASEVFRRRDKNIKGYTGVGIKSSVPSFPWAFTVAVQIDSLVDGMLLGLATVTGESAGVFMALALSFEMGFLGLTYSMTCKPQPMYKRLIANVFGPFVIILGALIGGIAANWLASDHAAFVGVTAFGAAALLFLVCEELLQQDGDEADTWWVQVQIYLGFILAFLLDQLADMASGEAQ